MADSGDFQALENISNEVDNSQVKILISSHCMKAQAFLLDKLKKQIERQKEICKFIGSNNIKLETEIKFAEHEIKSLNLAIETIKLGNIEINKEYLLSTDRKAEIFERTKTGKKKYDDMWSMSKRRYESIPIVQKLIEVKNKNELVQANINAFINESKHLIKEIKLKKNDLEAIDRACIIQLAVFFVHERTKILININENSVKIGELLNEVEILNKEDSKHNCNALYDKSLPIDRKQAVEAIPTKDSTLEDNWSTLSKNTEKDTSVLPKLYLQNNGLDVLSIKLDQINKVDLQNTTSIKRASSSILSGYDKIPAKNKTEKDSENYISSYFEIPLMNTGSDEDKKTFNENYSEKKLIHILEDIKLDKNETYCIIKNLEANQFQPTKYITSKNTQQNENISNTEDEKNKTIFVKENKCLETGEFDEIKLSKTREDVVDPPSQFLDVSQISQEKKTVLLNMPSELETQAISDEDIANSKGIDINIPEDKQLDNSIASEESYTVIKDKMLKKHNLDLSPQFVYSRSTQIHKKNDDMIASKYFDSENTIGSCNDFKENDYNKKIKEVKTCGEDSNKYENDTCTMQENRVVVSSPKVEIKNLEVPVAGLLFNHGSRGIQDSLNLSISTTGFEDSEDFPHCIDSTILLSPKADIPATIQSSDNEVLSQEVPNFLAGFRKTGISFFGSTTSDSKPGSSAQPQSGGFNFAFSNEEKKGRGGFFSMFH